MRVLNPEMPKEIQNGKECILDVKAKIDGKEIVNIEMHFIELPKFKKKYPKIESALEEWLTLFVTQGKNNMSKDIE